MSESSFVLMPSQCSPGSHLPGATKGARSSACPTLPTGAAQYPQIPKAGKRMSLWKWGEVRGWDCSFLSVHISDVVLGW